MGSSGMVGRVTSGRVVGGTVIEGMEILGSPDGTVVVVEWAGESVDPDGNVVVEVTGYVVEVVSLDG